MEDYVTILKVKQDLFHAHQLAIQHLLKKLEQLGTEFNEYHYSIIEMLENEEDLEDEQAMLDDHDDKIPDLVIRLQVPSSLALGKQLDRIKCKIIGALETVDTVQLGPNMDRCVLRQLEEQVASLLHELPSTRERLLY